MTENGPPRRVRVDFEALIAAFEDPDYETSYFLDVQSGEILSVLEANFEEEDLHPVAAEIDSHPDRYLGFPDRNPDDLLEDLATYVRENGAEDVLVKVKEAIGAGLEGESLADLFSGHDKLAEGWESYRKGRQRDRLVEWLTSHNVEAVETETGT